MSFLDLDEWLFELERHVTLVYSPIADVKQFPAGVDVTVVEGAVANEEHLTMIKTVRANSAVLISIGDCAVTGNVTALRNALGPDNVGIVLDRAYRDAALLFPQLPNDSLVPQLLDRVLPVHAVVPVDLYLPGCPPPSQKIRSVLEGLLSLP
jgi:NAD-reducing hydrogenase small subunit